MKSYEADPNPKTSDVDSGSSPRLWGTQDFGTIHYCLVHPHAVNTAVIMHYRRFIPTPVGNTATRRCERFISRRLSIHFIHACGSSPRLWGTHARSYRTQARHCHLTVHPHACGEHVHIAISTSSGSSPEHERNASIAAVHPHACGEHVKAVYALA